MSLDLYPSILLDDSIKLNAETCKSDEIDKICDEIYEATVGFGSDEHRLLKAMGKLRADTRCKVPIRYKALYEKKLVDVMKSECGNRDFGTALQLLAVNPIEADCMLINIACKGLGTNEFLLSTILCGRSNKDMTALKKTYFDLYTQDLGRKLDSELRGNIEKLIFNVLQADVDEDYSTEKYPDSKVEEDVKLLHTCGQGKWGTDEAGIFKILCGSPSEHLQKVNLMYADKYGNTIPKMLELELGGLAGDGAAFMLGMKLKPMETLAGLIDKACAGFGTNELLLTSVIVRYQPVLNDIRQEYAEEHKGGKGLEERVKSETRGDYRELLMELLSIVEC